MALRGSACAEGNQQVPGGLAEHRGVCEVWQGRREKITLQADRIARKAHKNGFEFSLDVPGGSRGAWICMARPSQAQPLAQPTTSNTWSHGNNSWVPAGKGGSAFCCTQAIKMFISIENRLLGESEKTGMNFQAETSAAKL